MRTETADMGADNRSERYHEPLHKATIWRRSPEATELPYIVASMRKILLGEYFYRFDPILREYVAATFRAGGAVEIGDGSSDEIQKVADFIERSNYQVDKRLFGDYTAFYYVFKEFMKHSVFFGDGEKNWWCCLTAPTRYPAMINGEERYISRGGIGDASTEAMTVSLEVPDENAKGLIHTRIRGVYVATPETTNEELDDLMSCFEGSGIEVYRLHENVRVDFVCACEDASAVESMLGEMVSKTVITATQTERSETSTTNPLVKPSAANSNAQPVSKASSVYIHTFPDGKKYVGMTSGYPLIRWNNGHGYVGNIPMYEAIKQYGWDNIQHDIVASGLTEQDARSLESKLIAEYGTLDPERGYNRKP